MHPDPSQHRECPQRRAVVLWAGPARYIERAVRIDTGFGHHRVTMDGAPLNILAQILNELRRDLLAPGGCGDDLAPIQGLQVETEAHEITEMSDGLSPQISGLEQHPDGIYDDGGNTKPEKEENKDKEPIGQHR